MQIKSFGMQEGVLPNIVIAKLFSNLCFKLLLLPALVFFNPIFAIADNKPIILSGFDDVLRQADNTGLINAALKIFEDDRTYSGMPELYSTITKERTSPHFFLVSAISSLFDRRIDNFLSASKYPSNHRYLRNWVTQWSIVDFKIDRIGEILVKKPDEKFIVIFDNSDASISLVQTLNEKFSDRISSIYLRQVVKKSVPKNAIGFYTAFDIALNEYANFRLTANEVRIVGQAILNEDKTEKLFPNYSVCPTHSDLCTGVDSEILVNCNQVRRHIQLLCKNKHPTSAN